MCSQKLQRSEPRVWRGLARWPFHRDTRLPPLCPLLHPHPRLPLLPAHLELGLGFGQRRDLVRGSHISWLAGIQERLTAQIANTIENVLKPMGIGVVIKATHHCMTTRGINKHGTDLVTSRMLGCFRENPMTRQEFL